jgi:hypothetical protein
MGENKKDKELLFSDEQLRGWDDCRKSLYVRQEQSHDPFDKARGSDLIELGINCV